MRRRHGVAALTTTLAKSPLGAAYGGQALVEGILMRGPAHIGAAFRAADGTIVVTSEPLPSGELRRRIARIPVVRGAAVLWETLSLGARWLTRSAEIASGNEAPSTTGSRVATTLMLVATLAIAVVGFNVVPAIAASWIAAALGGTSLLVERAIDGALQVLVLIGYLALVGRSRDIDRTYRYHGAEHRAIHALENGEPLTRATLARWPTAHPRCGTEFLVVVILVSIVSFSLVGRLDPIATIASRLLGIPLVAGVAYELLRLLGRYRRNPVARLLAAPGIAVQSITTRAPDDAMHDVAIAALTAALEAAGAAAPAGSERPAWRTLAPR